jgi:putative hydrolase of the HAD superfamily
MRDPQSKIGNPRSDPAIRAFAFDLGQVLLEFDVRIALKNLGARCEGGADAVVSLLRENDLALQLESGRISGREFYSEFQRRLQFKGNYEEFCAAYADIFRENAPMIELMRALKKRFAVYLLSNTNEIHIDFITKRHAFLGEFDGHVYSYREGVMKPDARYFQRLLDRFSLQPPEVVFVDDLLVNVEGARAVGMVGVHYQNAAQARAELMALAQHS